MGKQKRGIIDNNCMFWYLEIKKRLTHIIKKKTAAIGNKVDRPDPPYVINQQFNQDWNKDKVHWEPFTNSLNALKKEMNEWI